MIALAVGALFLVAGASGWLLVGAILVDVAAGRVRMWRAG